MHAVTRTLLFAILCGLFALMGPNPPLAFAADCGTGSTPSELPDGGIICIPAATPGTPGGRDSGDEGTTSTGCQDADGTKIPCKNEQGAIWIASQKCYGHQLIPPPGPADPVWNGHDPSEGSIWYCPYDGISQDAFFLPGSAPVIDPAVLAQRVVDRMQLATPTVHMAPQPPLMTYVGLETWLWMNSNQWRTISESASVGNTSVTVIAKPVRVMWDLTDGTKKCTSAGRAWIRGMGSNATTDCSYTFQKVSDFEPSDEFPVTAQLIYSVDWSCSGTCLSSGGTLGEVPGLVSASTSVRVGERQSVVID